MQTRYLAAPQNCLAVTNQGLRKFRCALLNGTQLWWDWGTNRNNKSSARQQHFCLVSIDCQSINPAQNFEMNLSQLSIAGTDKGDFFFLRDACGNRECGVSTLITSFGFWMVNKSLKERELELRYFIKGCSAPIQPEELFLVGCLLNCNEAVLRRLTCSKVS